MLKLRTIRHLKADKEFLNFVSEDMNYAIFRSEPIMTLKDLGYEKRQVLNAAVHMDETTLTYIIF